METKLIYSEPVMRQAVFGFWRRTLGVSFPTAVLVLAVCLVWQIFQGERSWIVGALGTILAVGAAMMVAIYVVHYRSTMARFREMGKPEATFRADEATFTVSTGIETSTVQWRAVKEVWQFRDSWLLLFSKAQFITLPTACLPSEMQAFILDRVKAAGGKVG